VRADQNATDLNAIYDENYTPIFVGADQLKVEVLPTAKIMSHPLEDGSTRSDHIVYNPVELQIEVSLTGANYKDVYSEIFQFYSTGTTIVVSTKTDNYENQLIDELPHEESPDVFDGITLTIKTKEVRFAATGTTVLPVNPADEDTNDQSTTQGVVPTPAEDADQSSTLFKWFGK